MEKDYRTTLKTEEREREEEKVRKNPSHKYSEEDVARRYIQRIMDDNKPEIGWLASSVLELIDDITRKEAWYFKGPKDDV